MVMHSLPSPSDGLHSRSCSWRHDTLVLSANQIKCNIFSEIRNFRRQSLEYLASKRHFCPILRSVAIGVERTRASWQHKHNLEWSPSDGKGESAWPRATWTVWQSGYTASCLCKLLHWFRLEREEKDMTPLNSNLNPFISLAEGWKRKTFIALYRCVSRQN